MAIMTERNPEWINWIAPDQFNDKDLFRIQELICRNEEKLRVTMSDEQKALFEKYTDCIREFQTMSDCLIFQNSFRLGARIAFEVMAEP